MIIIDCIINGLNNYMMLTYWENKHGEQLIQWTPEWFIMESIFYEDDPTFSIRECELGFMVDIYVGY